MNKIILERLAEIERKEHIKMIHAAESGSYAWGFSSVQSDHDVRFVYVRPLEYYLRLDKTRDVIEYPESDNIDIIGWDLQKALKLLYKSNPTIFEWSHSPIIYRTTPQWEEISMILNDYFQSASGLHHYLNAAKHNYIDYLKGDVVRIKKYFYVIRPILACKWILEKHETPPMLFSELCKAEHNPIVLNEIHQLLNIKMNNPEILQTKRIDTLNAYIEQNISEIQGFLADMPSSCEKDWNTLNRLFFKIVTNGKTVR